MDLASNEPREPEALSSDTASSGKGERMAPWRWLLFAAMARYEAGEEVYLRIPAPRLSRCDRPVPIPWVDYEACDRARRESPDLQSAKGTRWAYNGPGSIPTRILGWLRRK
jgi:hypothetical protein